MELCEAFTLDWNTWNSLVLQFTPKPKVCQASMKWSPQLKTRRILRPQPPSTSEVLSIVWDMDSAVPLPLQEEITQYIDITIRHISLYLSLSLSLFKQFCNRKAKTDLRRNCNMLHERWISTANKLRLLKIL